jgi:hypothetical protein
MTAHLNRQVPHTRDTPQSEGAKRSPHLIVGRLVLVATMSIAMLGGCVFFDEIDRCLDAGGRWNHTTDTCEREEKS